MKQRTIPFAGTLALALLAGASLTGCAPAQSKEDACDIFSSADLALVEAITSSGGSLIDDPATAAEDLDSAVSTFEKDVSAIENAEVKEPVTTMTAALNDFNAHFAQAAEAAVQDPDSVDNAALSESLSAAEDAEAGVATVCNS